MSGWSVLYAVTDAEMRAGSAPARLITAAGLRAWGGPDPARAGEVCLKLARKGGCLPARSGARIQGGPNAIREWLRRSAKTLHAKLNEIDGRVEFVATLESWIEPAAPTSRAKSGAAYLRGVAAAAAQQRAVQATLRQQAHNIADTLPGRLATAPRRVVDAASGRVDLCLLAPSESKAAFALGLIAQARLRADVLRLSGSGPWAPHSFADISPDVFAEEPANVARA